VLPLTVSRVAAFGLPGTGSWSSCWRRG